jgi:hypothetical protein
VTVVAGSHILAAADLPPRLWRADGGAADGPKIHITPAGPPCVAPWAGLTALAVPTGGSAGSGAALPDGSDRVIVIEHDQRLGGLGVAVFDPVPAQSATGNLHLLQEAAA